jgi:hypothetical protein
MSYEHVPPRNIYMPSYIMSLMIYLWPTLLTLISVYEQASESLSFARLLQYISLRVDTQLNR